MRGIVLLLAAATAAFALEGRHIVDYRISARLDAKAHAIEGSEVLIWRNLSPNLVGELQFHLYMNAFRNAKSTFAKESRRRDEKPDRKHEGWIDVKRMQIEGGADLTKAIRFIHPDDDNADDRTVISVPLPAPVHPGGSITLQIDFYTKLPEVVARAGYYGDFNMVAQWFPKIGVWEGAGKRHALWGHWSCHQYHALSEFYADYGRFDVRITVPSKYVVGATGAMQEQTRDAAAGTTTYRYVQADVHDFAWTAQPQFVRFVRTFDPAREVSPKELADTAQLLGLPEADVRLRPVQVIVLMQPEHAAQIERHVRAVFAGIKYFGLWYGAYPYDTLTVVDPPYGGEEAGGMEYPTLITTGTEWLLSQDQFSPEEVTIHEFGHQYWYGLVGNNEFEESWLDEGFNTYSTGKVIDLVYGPQRFPVRILGVPLGGFLRTPLLWQENIDRGAYLLAPKADSIVRNAWQYYDRLSYGLNSYNRPSLTLRTLENYLGSRTMARIMRTYQLRWRYRHPASADFFAVVNDVSELDMHWFFDQFVFGSNVVDYAVGEVRDQTVLIRRRGDATFPVDISVRFADGKTEQRHWDGRYRWIEFKFDRKVAITSVEIDPEHKVLLDVDFANNSHTERYRPAPLVEWTEKLLFWTEHLLLSIAGAA